MIAKLPIVNQSTGNKTKLSAVWHRHCWHLRLITQITLLAKGNGKGHSTVSTYLSTLDICNSHSVWCMQHAACSGVASKLQWFLKWQRRQLNVNLYKCIKMPPFGFCGEYDKK